MFVELLYCSLIHMNVFQITDFDWLFWQQNDLIFLLTIALYSGECCGPCGLYFKSAQFVETVTLNTCTGAILSSYTYITNLPLEI